MWEKEKMLVSPFLALFSKAFLLELLKVRILDSSKLKGFADDSFRFDENGRKLFERVENTVGKGEIAH